MVARYILGISVCVHSCRSKLVKDKASVEVDAEVTYNSLGC